MPKDWYLRKNGKIYGPLAPKKLKSLSNAGKITSKDEVANSKGGPWHPVTKLKGLNFNPASTAPRPASPPAQKIERPASPLPIKKAATAATVPTPQPVQYTAAQEPANYAVSAVPQSNQGADTRALLQYQAHSKSAGLAYAFWFFLGMWGAHRFYCGKTGSGVAMLLITLISIPLCFVLIGFVGIFAVAIWALIDAILISGWIRDYNSRLAGMVAP